MSNKLEELIKLANELDDIGEHALADKIDEHVKNLTKLRDKQDYIKKMTITESSRGTRAEVMWQYSEDNKNHHGSKRFDNVNDALRFFNSIGLDSFSYFP